MKRLLLSFALCLLALPAAAQFNGTNGIFTLNHMTSGVMNDSRLTIASSGTGYVTGDTVTLDCPNDVYFPVTRPQVSITASAGAVTSISLINPGVATKIPSTGVAGGNNGFCTFVQSSSSGSGQGLTVNGYFGFIAAGSSGGGGSSGGEIDLNVRMSGMNNVGNNGPFDPAKDDNSQYVQALMNLVMPAADGGTHAVFAPVHGEVLSPYYFSQPLQISRAGTWDCGGYSPPLATSGSVLVFAPGIDGVRLEIGTTSPDGGSFQSGTFANCYVRSLGYGTVTGGFTVGAATIVASMAGVGTDGVDPGAIPASQWLPGDGFILWGAGPTTWSASRGDVASLAESFTGSVTNGVLTLATTGSGTFALGAPLSGAGIGVNIGLVYPTALLSGSLGANGSTYSLNQNNIPNVASTTLTSSYATMTIPPTLPTAATASFLLHDLTVSVAGSSCIGILPGETLFDITINKTIGTVKYCIHDTDDTIYLNGTGAAAGSSGASDSVKFWSMTTGPIYPGAATTFVSRSTGNVAQQQYDSKVTAQQSSSESGGALGGGGVYTLSSQQPGISNTVFSGVSQEFAPASPPGSYVDSVSGTGSAQTLTLHPGFEPTRVSTGAGHIWQLPAIQAYTVSTTAGSRTLTTTIGPSAQPGRLLEPGDFIVSDAFTYGCVVNTQTGPAQGQTITVQSSSSVSTAIPSMQPCNALSSGTHKLWVMPSGIRLLPQGQLHNNFTYGFPVGVNFYVSGGSVPALNGTGSFFQSNITDNSLIGMLEAGNNSAASGYYRNEGFHNYYTDFAMIGTLGNSHYADNSNSSGADGYTTVVTFCGSDNGTIFHGSYLNAASTNPWCLPDTGMVFMPPHIGVTNTSQGWIEDSTSGGPIGATSINKIGFANGTFQFAPDPASPGIYMTTTQEPVTGQIFQMYMTTAGAQTPAQSLGWDYNPLYDNWQTAAGGNAAISSAMDVWGVGAGWVPAGGYAAGLSHTNYVPVHEFPLGFMIGGTTIGNERYFDAGTSTILDTANTITASQAFLSTSNILAVSSTTGVTGSFTAVDTTISATTFLGTVNSANSTQNWLTLTGVSLSASSTANDVLAFDGADPIAASDNFGTTMTKIPVASCAGVAGGQTVTNVTQFGLAVGTVSACGTQATMVLSNAAGAGHASSGTGDTIVVAARRQGDCRTNLSVTAGGVSGWCVVDNVGTVVPSNLTAAETTGKAWPTTSTKTTIASLPTCAAGISGSNAVVTNGTTVGVGGYGSAIGATGAATRRVFCDGTDWLYD